MRIVDARTGLEIIEHRECLRLLLEHEVGRVGVAAHGRPEIFPVNYVFDGDAIVFRTDPGTKLDAAGRGPACFEIDGFDPIARTGWSVVVHGRLEPVDQFGGPAADRARALPIEPWAGDRTHWLRVVPDAVAGRRVGG